MGGAGRPSVAARTNNRAAQPSRLACGVRRPAVRLSRKVDWITPGTILCIQPFGYLGPTTHQNTWRTLCLRRSRIFRSGSSLDRRSIRSTDSLVSAHCIGSSPAIFFAKTAAAATIQRLSSVSCQILANCEWLRSDNSSLVCPMSDNIQLCIGARIRAARTQQGLTVAEVGHRIGLTSTQVSKYEIGESTISVSTLTEIARVLSVPVASLLDEIATRLSPTVGLPSCYSSTTS